MSDTVVQSQGGGLERPQSSSLADVLNVILDKGLVIDAYVRVSLVGIEILTIDARIVIASVDTYLRFAEATSRLNLSEQGGKGLPDMIGDTTEGVAHGKAKGILSGVADSLFGNEEEQEQEEQEKQRAVRRRRANERENRRASEREEE
jgi:hypothetical protein